MSYQALRFDLAELGKQLDESIFPARVTVVVLPVAWVGLSTLLLAVFVTRILAGTLDEGGWTDLLIVWGFTAFFWVSGRNAMWQCRRAAISVALTEEGVEIGYPEGRARQLSWSDPRATLKLVDLSSAEAVRRGALSTSYLVSDRDRRSALPEEAYAAILEAAHSKGTVAPAKLRGSGLFSSSVPGRVWTLSGR